MRNFLILLAMTALLASGGCRKTAKTDSLLAQADNDLVGQLHFIGTDQIAADPKAAELNSFGRLPATAEMRDALVDKMARAPFRIIASRVANHNTNDYVPLLRPLVEDLLRSESYAEMRGPTNQIPELLLAIRLDAAHSKIWQSNLSTVISAWTGIAVTPIHGDGFEGWELKKHHDPNVIRCLQAGDWTLFGWGWNDISSQANFLQRIKGKNLTADCSKTALMEVVMNWPALQAHHILDLPFPIPSKLPRMHLVMEEQKEFVRSTLAMKFPEPLGITLDPWKIPTNIVQVPFSSFVAVRGIGPWLGDQAEVKQLKLPSVPNQMTMWAAGGVPFDTSVAFPLTNASNYLATIQSPLIAEMNAKQGGYVGLKAIWNGTEITAQGSPLVNYHIKSVHETNGDFLVASFFPSKGAAKKPEFPNNLMREILSKPNLVYYGWELGTDRVFQWEAIHQVDVLMSGRNFPGPDSPIEKWLLTARPKFGTCGTEITQVSPTELNLVRNSKLGFSGFELTMLEFWLDSPNFPFRANYPQPVPPASFNRGVKAK